MGWIIRGVKYTHAVCLEAMSSSIGGNDMQIVYCMHSMMFMCGYDGL